MLSPIAGMARKAKAAPESVPTPNPVVPATPLVGVLVAAFFASLLGLYQWMELLVASAGGDLSCSISTELDCAPVWGSPFAKAIARATGMPVAAWGVVWGLAAFLAGVLVLVRVLRREESKVVSAAHVVRLVAVGGLASSLVLAFVSMGMVGVACPTCLFTYALVIGFSIAAFKLPGPRVPPGPELGRAVAQTAGIVLVAYLVLLLPARRTPAAPERMLRDAMAKTAAGRPDSGVADAPHRHSGPTPVGDFLASLDAQARQLVADALAAYRAAPARPPARAARFRLGPASAPIALTEWTDIKCGHCASFTAALEEIERQVPAGQLSVEPRQFPLDSECNPSMQRSDLSGVRCAAARALICLEGKEQFSSVQLALFKEQVELQKPRILELAAPAAGGKEALERCMTSEATNEKLRTDISDAIANQLRGTPLVLINGREATPFPPFVFALIVAGGDPNHAGFDVLPAPRAMAQQP